MAPFTVEAQLSQRGVEEEVVVDSLFGPRVLELDGSHRNLLTAKNSGLCKMWRPVSFGLVSSPFTKKWTDMGTSDRKVLLAIVARRNLQMRERIEAQTLRRR